jgi:SepF-like predicted cell division protein (DUF552 family)
MMLVSVAQTPEILKEPVSVQTEVKKEISVEIATTTENVIVVDITNATSSADIKKITKEYFKNTPVLAEIARCESEYRQFSTTGNTLRGRVNSADVGVMQINEKYHLARSKQLGINIYTLEGNLKYGSLLYKEQGSQPWSASRPCWGKTEATLAVKI